MADNDNNKQELSTTKENTPEKKKAAPPPKKPGRFSPERMRSWWREMRSELKKVVWPTPKQIVNNTIIVVIAVLFVGTLISVFDFGADRLVRFVITSLVK